MSEEQVVINLDGEDKRVPLTIYIEGERIVVGAAVMSSDGSVTAMMDAVDDPRAQKILDTIKGEFKFGLPQVKMPVFKPEFTAGELPYDGPVPQHPDDILPSVGSEEE
jgi:hypothetical protein